MIAQPNQDEIRTSIILKYLSKERGGTVLGVSSAGKSLLTTLSRGDSVWQREFDFVTDKLHWVVTFQVFVCDNSRSDDSDRARSCTVSAGHFIVQLAHGANQFHITEFTVHIVRTRARIISQPDSVILHCSRVLFDQFDTVQDFTSSLLHLTKLVHVIPEFRFGNNGVGGENNHAVCLRVGVVVGSRVATDHLELLHHASDSHPTTRK
mmetsp:Transcript_18687/g.38640  ORF Transcript_18687/g.38640 Transcript_18687/m.38640 type:complete len:208 (+) Transcript_18687:127-750(+)